MHVSLLKFLPELFIVASLKKAVKRIFINGSHERSTARQHDKEDDSQSKYVAFDAVNAGLVATCRL